MKKISTINLELLPRGKMFQDICKSISALEAIICPEWNYRYFSYDKDWSIEEEVCEMRDGNGDHMLTLFKNSGIVINGFAHESEMNGWRSKLIPKEEKKKKSFLNRIFSSAKKTEVKLVQKIWEGVIEGLPKEFEEFIFGEPIKSIGTTFCIWQKPIGNNWQIGNIQFPDDEYLDGSGKLLNLLDGNPITFKNWAEVYYDEQFRNSELHLETVQEIYNQHKITRHMVEKINPDLDDFEKLKSDLVKIGYENEI